MRLVGPARKEASPSYGARLPRTAAATLITGGASSAGAAAAGGAAAGRAAAGAGEVAEGGRSGWGCAASGEVGLVCTDLTMVGRV